MRKAPLTSAVVAILGLTAVGLVGCSAPSAAACDPVAANPELLDLVSAPGTVGEEPEIDVYAPFHAETSSSAQIIEGDGAVLESDDQIVVLDVTLLSGVDGSPLLQTAYDGTSPAIPLSDLVQSIPALSDGMRCAQEGSRTVIAIAPGDIQADVAANLGLTDEDSTIAIVDLEKVFLAKADGADVFNAGFGLPAVVRAPSGQPGIVVPDAAPPTEVVVQTLKRGTGDVVGAEDTVRAHYTGVVWATKEEFDSSWGSEPAALSSTGVIPGFAQALEGQTVGSQVMVVVPPDAGYGDQEQGLIPAGSTLVFVIDILGIETAAQ